MSEPQKTTPQTPAAPPAVEPKPAKPKEVGGPKGLEPTRYGDWEKNGRCIDF
jgi:hypothetical protein